MNNQCPKNIKPELVDKNYTEFHLHVHFDHTDERHANPTHKIIRILSFRNIPIQLYLLMTNPNISCTNMHHSII